ncbi:MAG TPA: ornithine carbamoyltransferase [Acidimicrobiales bacterium]|nr:ornithine carbamoyltransferase [Acidimicrobiales bacterium]
MKHVLDMDDLSAEELVDILDLAARPDPAPVLAGQAVAMVFQKPSLRTRVSMERAAVQLGGHPVSVRDEEVGLDTRETAEDVARLLSQYAAVVGARVFAHATVERLALAATVPVVNLLSDAAHPCQILGDLLLLRGRWGPLAGHTVAWVGDGNNVCQSLLLGAALCGLRVRVACPPGHEPSPDAVADAGALVTADPAEAVAGAEAVYTDVWTSMGQEDEAAERRQAFAGFTVDEALMALAAPGALFLHCLPAHRGEEVSAAVIDGPQSAVWDQAASRTHAQRGLLWWLAGR